jgi:hypothetical protein
MVIISVANQSISSVSAIGNETEGTHFGRESVLESSEKAHVRGCLEFSQKKKLPHLVSITADSGNAFHSEIERIKFVFAFTITG